MLRETVSAMQKRLATQATSVGVNGDYFAPSDGRPSGIFLRDGVLATPPNPARSSAGITLDGLLDVRRVSFRGTWRGTGQRRALNFLNKAPGTNGISLFTSDWGSSTPRIAGAFAAVLGSFPPATPNTDLAVPVTTTATERVGADRAGNRGPRRARERSGEAPGGGAAGDGRDASAHPPARLVGRLGRDRRWARPRSRRRARLPLERGLHHVAARSARAAHGGRPARGRGHRAADDRRDGSRGSPWA